MMRTKRSVTPDSRQSRSLRIMTVNGLHPDDNEGVRPLAEQRGKRVTEESEDRKNLMEQPQGKTDSQNSNYTKEPNHLRAQ
jgi:hypothetical protein